MTSSLIPPARQAEPSYPPPPPPPPVVAKAAWWRRRWVHLVAVGFVAFSIGAAAVGANAHEAELKNAKAHAADLASQVSGLQDQLQTTQSDLAAAQSEADQAHSDAQKALAQARQQVKAENAATAKKLRQRAATLDARSHALDVREAKVTGEERSYRNNSIPGDGTFIVGQDIQPGVYQAAGTSGCYWARLSSLNTSDIIDNNIGDGPMTVQIYSTDRAFETSGCATFHKVG